MRILILSDGQGWIVDRISQTFKEKIKHDIDVFTRTNISPAELLTMSSNYDIIHYNNWGLENFMPVMAKIKTKQILTVRSRRYKPFIFQMAGLVNTIHVINQIQVQDFPKGVWIPDGVYVEPEEVKKFKVGMAFQDTKDNWEYKGYHIVKQACDLLGVELEVVSDLKPEEMVPWYKTLNLFVCASVDEGFSAPAMECMALNVPVITTDVGMPSKLNVTKVARDYESIANAIGKLYTTNQILPTYSWDFICLRMSELYENTFRSR